ncbi:unnamed protein product [Rangifer tarandus platyrhynchus]|uniref:Uncharacterized protein n=2 Tax=Rangifer tarandus platyrhynchus TaxID=3082113 RepID=A0ABN8YI65_RANTA|nr:unnamed protein product [Rangifer tarandus platyrhynchus]
MAQLSHTWEVRDPYPPQASDREPAITLPSLQVVPGALDPTPKAFIPPFSSVQFSRPVVSDSLRPCGLQHARLPCPSPTPGAYFDASFKSLCPSQASSSVPPHAQPPPPPK